MENRTSSRKTRVGLVVSAQRRCRQTGRRNRRDGARPWRNGQSRPLLPHPSSRSGKDKGKQGKVMSVDPKAGKVVVEKVNMVSRHTKPRQQGQQSA